MTEEKKVTSIDKEVIEGMVNILNDAFESIKKGENLIPENRVNSMLKDLKELEEETGYILDNSPTKKYEVIEKEVTNG